MRKPNGSGTVYAIAAGGRIKIGFTSGPVARRLGDLRRMNGADLRLVTTWRGDRRLEKQMHQHFAKHRVHGEWFDMPADWRHQANEIAGLTPAVIDFDAQSRLADRFLQEIHCCGVSEEEVTHFMILDCLAMAGLVFVEDETGAASMALYDEASEGVVAL